MCQSSECFRCYDVGRSDHHLLTWPLPGRKVPPASQTVRRRPSHHVSQLRDELKAPAGCESAAPNFKSFCDVEAPRVNRRTPTSRMLL